MSLRALSLCLALFHFLTIFRSLALAASNVPGIIKLYDDYNCENPSTISPTVTLPLSTCLVTTGGEGLVIAETPPCPQGTATMLYYQDTACGVQTTSVSRSIFASNCWQLADGTNLYNARSVMFACPPVNNPVPSSTTTAVVSALAAVATGSPGSTGNNSPTSAAGSTPTDTNTQKSGTGTGSSGSNSTGGGSTSTGGGSTSTGTGSGSGSSSGLDTSNIVALAVGLGIGIPTIIIMLAGWLVPDFRHKLKRWFSGGMVRLPLQRNEPRQWHRSGMLEMNSPLQHQQQQPPYHYGY